MNKWIKKFFVTIVTVLTFGLISPYQAPVNATAQINRADNDEAIEEKQQSTEKSTFEFNLKEETQWVSPREKFLEETLKAGEIQALQKFGSKIGPVIEDEFQNVILPKIEKALEEVTNQFPEEELTFLSVSEVPAGGLKEKIFHVYNEQTGVDIIRFHVRRELRPQEGYWFNFHYHTYHDGYQAHHDLGEIYWDKNTPPKWKS